ncbi:MAG: hypothetical protein GY698_15145, partial [Actinomycetia bacterium]|nr:hypothetical protein [Actinomycetes bacterium]
NGTAITNLTTTSATGAALASGGTYDYNHTTGVLKIHFAGSTSAAAAEAILEAITFGIDASDNDPSTTARTVTLNTVTDNGGGTDTNTDISETATISVGAQNDVPTITNLAGDGLAYSEGDRAVIIEQGSDVIVADVDSTDFDTGTLTVSFTAGSDVAEDILGIRNQGYSTGEISIAGWGVAYGGTLIGSFEGGANGDDLVITFN